MRKWEERCKIIMTGKACYIEEIDLEIIHGLQKEQWKENKTADILERIIQQNMIITVHDS